MSEVRAARWRGNRLELTRVPRSEPGPGEARVRLEACGICGTDLHFRGAGLWPAEHTPGHEMIGRVELLGDAASGPAIGTRVAVEPLRGCGDCGLCQGGRVNLCPRLALYGIHLAGGFAEEICVPAERLHPLPESLPMAVAAMTEPVAVCVHGLRQGGLAKGQRVLVLGAGTIGLLSVAAARALGAGEVWISARHPHQAERARALGAHRVLEESEASPARLAAQAEEAEIDLVLETVGGSADTLEAGVAAVRPGGTLAVLGLFDQISLPPFPLLLKETRLAWSNCYAQGPPHCDFRDAIELLEAERDDLEALATHAMPLAQIESAFAVANDKGSGAVKVTLSLE